MDTRVIHEPDDMEDPLPLTDAYVEDNVQLCLSTAKSMGIRLPSYDSDDWFNEEKHVSIVLALLRAFITRNLEKYVSISMHPELIRLAYPSEKSEAIDELGPYDWIPRWINRTLKRQLDTEIVDYNDDLMKTVAALHPEFACPARSFSDDPETCSAALIDFLNSDACGLDTRVRPCDLMAENKDLQDLLASQIMEFKSGIPRLDKREQSKFKSVVMTDTVHTGDEAMVNFLNSMLPGKLSIKNLAKDLSDGVVILKILDKVKPGCVDWDKVRDREHKKIRHKFDMMGNCNYAMKLAKDVFKLKLMSAGGEDLHGGNQKVIHSFLWQVMRYQAIQTLSSLSFDGKEISEDDILLWANETIVKCGELADAEEHPAKSEPISNFKDKQLTTACFYLDIIRVIMPGAVKPELINYDLEAAKGGRDLGDEETVKKRLMNARYAMTLARREGAELFILAEDLVAMEQKAVLSMFAALMTIAYGEMRGKSVEAAETDDAIAVELGTGFSG
jgi:plastin-1